jgi:hypothetical protein
MLYSKRYVSPASLVIVRIYSTRYVRIYPASLVIVCAGFHFMDFLKIIE